jgi:hypothetical protein
VIRGLLVATLGATAVLTLTACESNQDRSARIEAEGKHVMQDQGTLKVTKANADVKVLRTALVHGGGSVAAAVELDNKGGAQADVPVLIDVTNAKGTSLYRNDQVGLQPSLQRLALIGKGDRVWWVNDQLLGADQGAKKVSVKVGAAAPVAKAPDVTVTGVHYETQEGGAFLTGTVVNHTDTLQTNLPVFAVALKGDKVVAAGRALVAKVPPGTPAKKPIFRLYFIGNPKGAKIQVTLAPNAKEAS